MMRTNDLKGTYWIESYLPGRCRFCVRCCYLYVEFLSPSCSSWKANHGANKQEQQRRKGEKMKQTNKKQVQNAFKRGKEVVGKSCGPEPVSTVHFLFTSSICLPLSSPVFAPKFLTWFAFFSLSNLALDRRSAPTFHPFFQNVAKQSWRWKTQKEMSR